MSARRLVNFLDGTLLARGCFFFFFPTAWPMGAHDWETRLSKGRLVMMFPNEFGPRILPAGRHFAYIPLLASRNAMYSIKRYEEDERLARLLQVGYCDVLANFPL
ncbi:MAG: hypothetical protein GY820_10285 [Gammaproteobacteria bacterium]|nr:hypothetical protein [Gammaproteobacteria bacterium]